MMDSMELIGKTAEEVVPQLNVEEESDRFARFVAEPLEAGYGITLGNAIRRVLLSSLEGAAVTSVRIEQVQHEFSTIPGMLEDTTDLLLNVKEIRLRAHTNRSGTLSLDAEGPGIVRAGDIQVPSDFEIVNPDLQLATLDGKGSKLNMEFHAQLGKGYVPAGSVEGMPIGVIPVDAVYSPIRKVNYRVEKTRVGQSTNYDRLVLEVWTDGTIDPVVALSDAADILMDQFSLFSQMGRPPVSSAFLTDGGSRGGVPGLSPDRYNTPIEDLQLSVRAYNCLKRSGLMTVGQVLEKSEDELLALRNFGRKSYDELRERLVELNYIDPDAEGLQPITESATAPRPQPTAPGRRPTRDVIIDEDDEEQSLGALGKALKEALKEVGDDDLLGADDEE
jgi:DNA-directed RNA polymerase subunit alpha